MEPLPAIGHEPPLPPCSTMPEIRLIFSSFKSIWDTSISLQRKATCKWIRPSLPIDVARLDTWSRTWQRSRCLLDQEAIMNGEAARGGDWKYYDLGHGLCANPFWAECPHRMACARCPYYRPKESLKDQLVEGKANLVRMLEFVSLTEEEKLLVTEGIELHQALIEQLADVPTPAGPTPRELEASRNTGAEGHPTQVGAAR